MNKWNDIEDRIIILNHGIRKTLLTSEQVTDKVNSLAWNIGNKCRPMRILKYTGRRRIRL